MIDVAGRRTDIVTESRDETFRESAALLWAG